MKMNGKMNSDFKVEGSGEMKKIRKGKMKRQNKERYKVILRLRIVRK